MLNTETQEVNKHCNVFPKQKHGMLQPFGNHETNNIMEWLLFFLFSISLGIYIKKEQLKKGASLNLGTKSSELKDYESSIVDSIKSRREDELKAEYYQKAKALGHSDDEIDLFWSSFNKYKHDDRFLKNLSSVRAKYVK